MKKKRKFKFPTKWVMLFIVLQLLGFIWVYMEVSKRELVVKPRSNGIFITAAHLDPATVGDQYKLIYSDKEKDIAYYLDKNYVGPRQDQQAVIIQGVDGAFITDSTAGQFTVSVSNPEELVGGLSGTRVYDSTGKNVIGFVSALIKGGKLQCVSIE